MLRRPVVVMDYVLMQSSVARALKTGRFALRMIGGLNRLTEYWNLAKSDLRRRTK